jgi:hypothetical protein
MINLPSVYITEKGVRHAKTGHPWVFEGEVVRFEGDPENGELVNVDGNGNRVTAISFGPKKVICVVGANKIVSDLQEGFRRIKRVAAPKNAVRLNTHTPCKTLGHCIYPDGDIATRCKSPDRLCAHYVVNAFQRTSGRIKVIICPENLGY